MYEVVADLHEQGLPAHAIGLGLMAIVLMVFAKFMGSNRYLSVIANLPRQRPILFIAVRGGLLGIAIVVLLISCKQIWGYWELSNHFRAGRCQVVEGRVVDFHATVTPRGGVEESFTVQGERFLVSNVRASILELQPHHRGGPIGPDASVRITHHLGDIVRVEVKRPAS